MRFFTVLKYIFLCILISYGILGAMVLIQLSMSSPQRVMDILMEILEMPFASTLGTIAFATVFAGSLLLTFLSVRVKEPAAASVQKPAVEADTHQGYANYYYKEISCVNSSEDLDCSLYDPNAPLLDNPLQDAGWLLCRPQSNTVIGRLGYIHSTANAGYIFISMAPSVLKDPAIRELYDACLFHLKLHAFSERKLPKIVYKSYSTFENELLKKHGFIQEGRTKDTIRGQVYTAMYWTCYGE